MSQASKYFYPIREVVNWTYSPIKNAKKRLLPNTAMSQVIVTGLLSFDPILQLGDTKGRCIPGHTSENNTDM